MKRRNDKLEDEFPSSNVNITTILTSINSAASYNGVLRPLRFIEPELLLTEVLHEGNKHFQPFLLM